MCKPAGKMLWHVLTDSVCVCKPCGNMSQHVLKDSVCVCSCLCLAVHVYMYACINVCVCVCVCKPGSNVSCYVPTESVPVPARGAGRVAGQPGQSADQG